jgi:hypothetical protein
LVIAAVIECDAAATEDEVAAAASAVKQALAMTVAAVAFLDNVEVTVYDTDGNVVGVAS